MKDTGKKRVRQLRGVRHTAVRHTRRFSVPAYHVLQVRLHFICYLQQAVSVLNKSNFPEVCSHKTDLWLLQYDDYEKCLYHGARRFLSTYGQLQKNSVAWSCVNIALLSVVISRFTNKISVLHL